MTNTEAIEILKSRRMCAAYVDSEYVDSVNIEAVDIAISALEKQIGKKPKHIDKNGVFDGNWMKVCPACGRVLMERITTEESSYPRHYNMTEYCSCGQRIDWRNKK